MKPVDSEMRETVKFETRPPPKSISFLGSCSPLGVPQDLTLVALRQSARDTIFLVAPILLGVVKVVADGFATLADAGDHLFERTARFVVGRGTELLLDGYNLSVAHVFEK